MELVDTHCHLFDPPMNADPAGVLARARAAGVAEVWVPGVDLESSTRALALGAGLPGVRVAVGLHPQAVGRDRGRVEAELAGLEALLGAGRAVAVGEIGLDAEVEGDLELQARALEAQLALAARYALPALVHCRGAFARLLSVLGALPGAGPTVLLHAWAGSAELLAQLPPGRCFFGVAGVATRPEATRARARVQALPLGRLVLETDAPYIGTRLRPKGAVEPADVREVCAELAALRGLSPEEVARQT
ncbi:MAG TPA: TatD family hydrolase, partial [Myxococcota bacterium]|nr:TatD family hydrolase [Myxococcota bacterium]